MTPLVVFVVFSYSDFYGVYATRESAEEYAKALHSGHVEEHTVRD